jgi:hypothetical protein
MAEMTYMKGTRRKVYQGKKLPVEEILKRAEKAQRSKDLFESLYRDAYEFA